MPSKQDSAEERRTDSWLFRLANKRNSTARTYYYLACIVSATVAATVTLTLLAVKVFR